MISLDMGYPAGETNFLSMMMTRLAQTLPLFSLDVRFHRVSDGLSMFVAHRYLPKHFMCLAEFERKKKTMQQEQDRGDGDVEL